MESPVESPVQCRQMVLADTEDEGPVQCRQMVLAETEDEEPSQPLQLPPEELLVRADKQKVQYSLMKFWSTSPRKEDIRPDLGAVISFLNTIKGLVQAFKSCFAWGQMPPMQPFYDTISTIPRRPKRNRSIVKIHPEPFMTSRNDSASDQISE